MGTLKKTEWSEERIQNILRAKFLSPSTKKYEIFNAFVYAWESDYLAITRSGYAYECEIKISKQDFKNEEKHKQHKNLILEDKIPNYSRPNYFYYVVPEGLLNVEDVPENRGLIYVHRWGDIEIVKQAPKLHNEKLSDKTREVLNDKFYYGMWNWRDKYFQEDTKELKRQIKLLEKTIMTYDDELSVANCEIDELKSELKKYTNHDYDNNK